MGKVKVEILTSCSGHNFSYVPGDKAEIPQEWVDSWVKNGLCRKPASVAPKNVAGAGKPAKKSTGKKK